MAWNEESVIERTLISLFGQTALRNPVIDLIDTEWEIVVVPNGCTDGTAEIAREALEGLVASTGRNDIAWAVHELAEAGKSNAWNHYIHKFSSPKSELMILIDADIEFGETETISNSVIALLSDTHAFVAVDQPLKDAVLKANKTIVERLSIAVSQANSGPPGIAGSFYCARASVLRQIWMPKGLSGEDGFLRAMVITDSFRTPPDDRRIIRAPNASHYFETLTSIRDVFQHEIRLVIGTALNCYLTWDLLYFVTDPNGPGAGELIRIQVEKDPQWYPRLVNNAISNHGWWVLPSGMLLRRFSAVGKHAELKSLKQVLVAVVGFIFDLIVFFAANRKLKRRNVIGYW